ncbi:H-NS histone family protein [Burkholderia alba]|uniref:H-NS histone family protein n=1 Tax=Burkholderia alba TaxID=2683677 RepID=UPI002B058591|nr:H-NS histone family protein [Burkholderia alba]
MTSNSVSPDLIRELQVLNERLADAKKIEKRAVLEELKQNVKLYDITLDDILQALGKRPKQASVRYYDPTTGNRWSGNGRRPQWLVGKNLDDYLIERNVKTTWWPGEHQ